MSFWEMIFIRWANRDSRRLTSWLQLVWWYISIYNPWDWGRRMESFRLACATRWNTVKKKQTRPSWSTHFCVVIFLSVPCVANIHVYHQHPFKNKTHHVCSVPCLQSPRTLQQCLRVYRWCFFPVRGEGSGNCLQISIPRLWFTILCSKPKPFFFFLFPFCFHLRGYVVTGLCENGFLCGAPCCIVCMDHLLGSFKL